MIDTSDLDFSFRMRALIYVESCQLVNIEGVKAENNFLFHP